MAVSPADKDSASREALPRSPELMRPDDTGLLVVDVQKAFVPVEPYCDRIVWNCRRLLDGAQVLGVRTFATEQYPEKLGSTVDLLADRLMTSATSKSAFSCGECGSVFLEWRVGDSPGAGLRHRDPCVCAADGARLVGCWFSGSGCRRRGRFSLYIGSQDGAAKNGGLGSSFDNDRVSAI